VGERSDRFAHGRQPVRPTELVGSTDVHEMAKRYWCEYSA
jgi:hypothetical protein